MKLKKHDVKFMNTLVVKAMVKEEDETLKVI